MIVSEHGVNAVIDEGIGWFVCLFFFCEIALPDVWCLAAGGEKEAPPTPRVLPQARPSSKILMGDDDGCTLSPTRRHSKISKIQAAAAPQ